MMPAVFTYNLKHNVMRFAQAAVRVWGLPDELRKSGGNGKRGHRVSARFLKSIGMPGNFAELGAKEEDIEKMAHTACYGDARTGSLGGFVELHEEDVANITG